MVGGGVPMDRIVPTTLGSWNHDEYGLWSDADDAYIADGIFDRKQACAALLAALAQGRDADDLVIAILPRQRHAVLAPGLGIAPTAHDQTSVPHQRRPPGDVRGRHLV